MADKVLKGRGACELRWDELGEGPRRFCTNCQRVVHDLDALTSAQVEQLVHDNPDGFCATFVSAEKGVFRLPSGAPSHARLTTAAAVVAAALMGCGDTAGVPNPPVETGTAAPEAPVEASKRERGASDEHASPPVHGSHAETAESEAVDESTPSERQLTDEELEMLRYLGYMR